MPHEARNNGDTDSRTAPYLPFATFISAIERLAPAAPDVIDKTIFGSFSGTAQSQVIAAFRFLGLIDSQNRSEPALTALVEIPQERKTALRLTLEAAYPDLFAIGLQKASPKQLDEAMERYNVYGATLRKAVSFFCKAAQFAEIPLSPFITRRKGKSGRRKNGARAKASSGLDIGSGADLVSDILNSAPVQKNSRTLKLGTGDAEITLSVKFDPFTISGFDRDYIFKLVDTLSNYKPPQPNALPKAKGAAVSVADDDPYGGLGVTDDDVPF